LDLPEWGGYGGCNPPKLIIFFCFLECIKEMTTPRDSIRSLSSRLSRTLSSLPSTHTYTINITGCGKSTTEYIVLTINIIVVCIVWQMLKQIIFGF
jgi:hypothetical protein